MIARPLPRSSLRGALLIIALGGCGGADKSTGPAHAGPFARVIVTAGNGQSGPAGAQLPGALVVKAVDADGTPVAGQPLSFVVTRGGGSVFAGANVSNVDGIAQERWTLGTSVADSQRVEVRAVDNTTGAATVYATFTATTRAAAPANVVVLGGGSQVAPAGTPVPLAPSIRVTDAYGNVVAGATVTFAATGGGGTVTGATATTDAAGSASVGSWTLGPVAGVQNLLTASVNGASTTILATASSPVRVDISAPTAGSSLTSPFTATVLATTLAPTGSIASVSATIDGRTTALVHGTGNSWSAPISMTGSTEGSKVLSVTAVDAAGNRSSTAVSVNYSAPLPTIPSSQSYVQLQSDAGDYVGQGRNYSYTRANATLGVTASGGRISVSVNGNQYWNGIFQMPGTPTQLQAGTYGGLTRGSLDWFGDGRGCNGTTGFMIIDSVTYNAGTLATLHMRFEQHCEGGAPALRGTVHWRAEDTTAPQGPSAIPAGLWQPPASALPATGNYTYLQSDPGDYIGSGVTTLYTAPSWPTSVTSTDRSLGVSVGGFGGTFVAMNAVTRIEPGYYPDLQRYPFNNAAKGGFDWSGNGRGCNNLQAWVAVDGVTYVGTTLTAIDLRFEQHCDGGPALHGAVHWASGS